jgi:hypothetical protein
VPDKEDLKQVEEGAPQRSYGDARMAELLRFSWRERIVLWLIALALLAAMLAVAVAIDGAT